LSAWAEVEVGGGDVLTAAMVLVANEPTEVQERWSSLSSDVSWLREVPGEVAVAARKLAKA
jgi:hypothetical protein